MSYYEDGNADLVDVELFSGDDVVRKVVDCARETGVATVGSSHDFRQTPRSRRLSPRLERMAELGCDIAKIAVMPQNPRMCLPCCPLRNRCTLNTEVPIITMSMGQLGLVSRLCGEVFGSALTFWRCRPGLRPGAGPGPRTASGTKLAPRSRMTKRQEVLASRPFDAHMSFKSVATRNSAPVLARISSTLTPPGAPPGVRPSVGEMVNTASSVTTLGHPASGQWQGTFLHNLWLAVLVQCSVAIITSRCR